jgi:hypothetical protein
MVLSLLGWWVVHFFGAVEQAILFETCPDMLAVFTGAKDTLMI